MEVPSLLKVALDSVVRHINTGALSPEHNFYKFEHVDLSNLILSTYVDSPNSRLPLSEFDGVLNVSKVDMTRFRWNEMLDFEFVKKLSLDSLTVETPEDWRDSPLFDIPSFLHKLLNEESKKRLRTLTLINHQFLTRKWPVRLGKMLPNLESLDLSGLGYFENADFKLLCRNFPNLKHLNLSSTEITSLDGISDLKNLEVLILESMHLMTVESLEDLFNCQTLRVLDVSSPAPFGMTNLMENYVKCGKGLDELRLLDLAGTDVNEQILKEILVTHKKLEQVVVIDTLLNSFSLPDVQLLNKSSHTAAQQSLLYIVSVGKSESAAQLMNDIAAIVHHNELDEPDEETKLEYVRIIVKALEEFNTSDRVHGRAMTCLSVILTEDLLEAMNPNDFTRFIDLLIEQSDKYESTTDQEMSQCNWYIWSLFQMPSVLENPVLKVEKLWTHAYRHVTRRLRRDGNREMTVMLKLFRRLEASKRRRILEQEGLLNTIQSFFAHTLQMNETIPAKLAEILVCFDIIRESLEIERCMLWVSEMRYMSKGCVDVLFAFVFLIRDPVKRKEATLRVFDIIVTLIRTGYTKMKCFDYLKGQAVFMMGHLNESFHPSDPDARINADIAYHVVSILTQLVNHKNLTKEHEDLFNRKSIEFCTRIDHRLISVSIHRFLGRMFLRHCLVDSENPGLVSWALLTLRIMLERDVNSGKMERDSELTTMVENLRSDKEEMMTLNEKVLDLLYSDFAHLLNYFHWFE